MKTNPNTEGGRMALVLLILILLYGIVGHFDYEAALAEEAEAHTTNYQGEQQ